MPTYKCGVFKDECPTSMKGTAHARATWVNVPNKDVMPCIMGGGCPVNESVVRASLIEVKKESIECELTKECGRFEYPHWPVYKGFSAFSMPSPTTDSDNGDFPEMFKHFAGKRVRITIEEQMD